MDHLLVLQSKRFGIFKVIFSNGFSLKTKTVFFKELFFDLKAAITETIK
jgi:hypothetical protein